MGRVDPKRLIWALHRGYLRHGWIFLAAWACFGSALVLAIASGLGWWQLRNTERELATRLAESRARPADAKVEERTDTLPLPGLEKRFDMNRQVLAGLESAGLEPDQIRFRFEDVSDAGLVRQTAVFKHKAAWTDIATMLENLQAARMPLYISKIRLERESPDDPLLTAEVQVAAALNRTPGATPMGGATP